MNRVALVVGGASGIGLASAVALAESGHAVAVADVAQSADIVLRLPGSGHRTYLADVADENSITGLFDAVEIDLGLVAVLVVCAGVSGSVNGKRPSLRETTLNSWNTVFAVNATGSFLCLREMFRRRTRHAVDNGRVILIGSMAAQDGGRNSPAAYVASKGAVHALVKSSVREAVELGMTVNCVAPGVIDTPMLRAVVPQDRDAEAFSNVPLRRVGSPPELAAAVAFLASAEASYITGACIDVNGGAHLS